MSLGYILKHVNIGMGYLGTRCKCEMFFFFNIRNGGDLDLTTETLLREMIERKRR